MATNHEVNLIPSVTDHRLTEDTTATAHPKSSPLVTAFDSDFQYKDIGVEHPGAQGNTRQHVYHGLSSSFFSKHPTEDSSSLGRHDVSDERDPYFNDDGASYRTAASTPQTSTTVSNETRVPARPVHAAVQASHTPRDSPELNLGVLFPENTPQQAAEPSDRASPHVAGPSSSSKRKNKRTKATKKAAPATSPVVDPVTVNHQAYHSNSSSKGQLESGSQEAQLHSSGEPIQYYDAEQDKPVSTNIIEKPRPVHYPGSRLQRRVTFSGDISSSPASLLRGLDARGDSNESDISIEQLPRHEAFNGIAHHESLSSFGISPSSTMPSSQVDQDDSMKHSPPSKSRNATPSTPSATTQAESIPNHHAQLHIETIHNPYHGPVQSKDLNKTQDQIHHHRHEQIETIHQPYHRPGEDEPGHLASPAPKKRATWYGVEVAVKDKDPKKIKSPRPLSLGFGYKEYAKSIVAAKNVAAKGNLAPSPVISESSSSTPQLHSPPATSIQPQHPITPNSPVTQFFSPNQGHPVSPVNARNGQEKTRPGGHYLTQSSPAHHKFSIPKVFSAQLPPNMGRSYLPPPPHHPAPTPAHGAVGSTFTASNVTQRPADNREAISVSRSQSTASQTRAQLPIAGCSIESVSSTGSTPLLTHAQLMQQSTAVMLKKPDVTLPIGRQEMNTHTQEDEAEDDSTHLYPEEESSYPRGDKGVTENPPPPAHVGIVEEVQLNPREMHARHDAHPTIMDKVKGVLSGILPVIGDHEGEEATEADLANAPEVSSKNLPTLRRPITTIGTGSSAGATDVAAALIASTDDDDVQHPQGEWGQITGIQPEYGSETTALDAPDVGPSLYPEEESSYPRGDKGMGENPPQPPHVGIVEEIQLDPRDMHARHDAHLTIMDKVKGVLSDMFPALGDQDEAEDSTTSSKANLPTLKQPSRPVMAFGAGAATVAAALRASSDDSEEDLHSARHQEATSFTQGYGVQDEAPLSHSAEVGPSLYPEEESSYPRGDKGMTENPPPPSQVGIVEEIQLDSSKMYAHHDAHPTIMDKVKGVLSGILPVIGDQDEMGEGEKETVEASSVNAPAASSKNLPTLRRESLPTTAVAAGSSAGAADVAAALRLPSSECDDVLNKEVRILTGATGDEDFISTRVDEPTTSAITRANTVSVMEKSTTTHPAANFSSYKPVVSQTSSGPRIFKKDKSTDTDYRVPSTMVTLKSVPSTACMLKEPVEDGGKKTTGGDIRHSWSPGSHSSFRNKDELDSIADLEETAGSSIRPLVSEYAESFGITGMEEGWEEKDTKVVRKKSLKARISNVAAPAAAAVTAAAAAYNQRQPSLKKPVLAISEQDVHKPSVPTVKHKLVLTEDDVDKPEVRRVSHVLTLTEDDVYHPVVPTVRHTLTLTEDDVYKPIPRLSARPVLRLTEDDVKMPDPSFARHPVLRVVEPNSDSSSALKVARAPRPMIPSHPVQGKDIKLPPMPKMPKMRKVSMPRVHLPKMKKPHIGKPKLPKVKLPKFSGTKFPTVRMPTLRRKAKAAPVIAPEITAESTRSVESIAEGSEPVLTETINTRTTKQPLPVVVYTPKAQDITPLEAEVVEMPTTSAPVIVATPLPATSRKAHVIEDDENASFHEDIAGPSKDIAKQGTCTEVAVIPAAIAAGVVHENALVKAPSTSLVVRTPSPPIAEVSGPLPVIEEPPTSLVLRTPTSPLVVVSPKPQRANMGLPASLVLTTPIQLSADVLAMSDPTTEGSSTSLVVRNPATPPVDMMAAQPIVVEPPATSLIVRPDIPLAVEEPSWPISGAPIPASAVEMPSTSLVVRTPTPPRVVMLPGSQLGFDDPLSSMVVKSSTPLPIVSTLDPPVIEIPASVVMSTPPIAEAPAPLLTAKVLTPPIARALTAPEILMGPTPTSVVEPLEAPLGVKVPTPSPAAEAPPSPLAVRIPTPYISRTLAAPPTVTEPAPTSVVEPLEAPLAVKVPTPPPAVEELEVLLTDTESGDEAPEAPTVDTMLNESGAEAPEASTDDTMFIESGAEAPNTSLSARTTSPTRTSSSHPPVTNPPLASSSTVSAQVANPTPKLATVSTESPNIVIAPEGYSGPAISVKDGETVMWFKKTRTTQYFYDSADEDEEELDEFGFRKDKDVSRNLYHGPTSRQKHSMEEQALENTNMPKGHRDNSQATTTFVHQPQQQEHVQPVNTLIGNGGYNPMPRHAPS
ncbi:hypothetical protein BGX31_011450 [Mortierella sp. GBA43]|nr:hypothetical protein BGX31_011450 [Mortierella sp. GBA43]